MVETRGFRPVAIICMGQGLTPDGQEVSRTAASVLRAGLEVCITKRHDHPFLYFICQGGWRVPGVPESLDEATAMTRWLKTHGVVPGYMIRPERSSLDSGEAARETAKIMESIGARFAYVVTPWNQWPRVWWLFFKEWRRRGDGLQFECKPVTVRYGPNGQKRLTTWWRSWGYNIPANLAAFFLPQRLLSRLNFNRRK